MYRSELSWGFVCALAAGGVLGACASETGESAENVALGTLGQAISADPTLDEGYYTEPASAPPRNGRPQFSAEEWQRLKQLSPLPELPPDTTNAYADSKKARKLGQKLFCDPGFSGPLTIASDLGNVGDVGKVSCASCHSGPSLDDRRSQPRNVSVGTGLHTRNAPGVVNSSFYTWTNWGGRFSAQWELPMPVTESPIIMNSSRLKVAHRIFAEYQEQYECLFGDLDPALGSDPARFPAEGKPKTAGAADGAWESMTASDRDTVNRIFVNYAKSMAAYFRALVSGGSRFDRFVAGDKRALDASEQRGAKLFIGKARCAGCHSGSHFSDDAFHNLGLPQPPASPNPDDGRFKDVPPLLASPLNAAGIYSDDPEAGLERLAELTNPMPESTRGAFRTPGLRGVAFTEPYMHAGQLPTLQAVVDFYDAGAGPSADGTPRLRPLGLTPEEKADLVAFLESLSGKAIPARLLCGDHDEE